MYRFEKLEIWSQGTIFVRDCYACAREFPDIERYALADQLRRAAISITNNIAEGSSTNETRDFSRFLEIAARSVLETANILLFSHSEGYISEQRKTELYNQSEVLFKKIKAFQKTLI